jgi:hypothetical protein
MSKWKQKGRYKKEYSWMKSQREKKERLAFELKRRKEIQRRARALEKPSFSILKGARKPIEGAPIIVEDIPPEPDVSEYTWNLNGK